MLADRRCTDSSCPNGGILILDANSIFFLVEGVILHAEIIYPQLTNSERLPYILQEFDECLDTMKRCCGLDGNLHISERVFGEVSLHNKGDVQRKGLIGLRKYDNAERRQMLRVLRGHLPQPRVTSEDDISALQGLFNDPRICPLDRDASLIVVACHLAADGDPVVVVTSDPDFATPLNLIVRRGSVTLAGESPFPTSHIILRHYFNFMRRLHDCCNLGSGAYEVLGNTYIYSQFRRLSRLAKDATRRRVEHELWQVLSIHTKAVQHKCAMA